MSFLVRRVLPIVLFVVAVVAASLVSYRCGLRQGFDAAPRSHYSVDVQKELRTNPLFREYIIGIYGREFRRAIDSVLASQSVGDVVRDWLRKEAPLCNPGSKADNAPSKPMTKEGVERIFFRKEI